MQLSIEKVTSKSKDGKNYLYCEKIIHSFFGNDYISFVVETNSFNPVLAAFSTLRNSFIDVKSYEDIKTLIAEDEKYAEIVDGFLFDLSIKNRYEAKKVLLRNFE